MKFIFKFIDFEKTKFILKLKFIDLKKNEIQIQIHEEFASGFKFESQIQIHCVAKASTSTSNSFILTRPMQNLSLWWRISPLSDL